MRLGLGINLSGPRTSGPSYGPELVVNGTFDADANWTKGAGWTIAGGKATATAAAVTVDLSQIVTLENGASYKVEYTISDYVAGRVSVFFTGTTGTVRGANGTFSETLVSTGTAATLRVRTVDPSNTYSIDNISIRKILN